MADRMRTMAGKAILSINDHPEIREIFKDFTMETVSINYTVGGGGERSKKAAELIVKSW